MHEHEPLIGTDSLIRCRTCGIILPQMTEEVCKVYSAKGATKVLNEMATAGKYRANSLENGFVVYVRERNGLREEVTGEKLSKRTFRVIKRLISV